MSTITSIGQMNDLPTGSRVQARNAGNDTRTYTRTEAGWTTEIEGAQIVLPHWERSMRASIEVGRVEQIEDAVRVSEWATYFNFTLGDEDNATYFALPNGRALRQSDDGLGLVPNPYDGSRCATFNAQPGEDPTRRALAEAAALLRQDTPEQTGAEALSAASAREAETRATRARRALNEFNCDLLDTLEEFDDEDDKRRIIALLNNHGLHVPSHTVELRLSVGGRTEEIGPLSVLGGAYVTSATWETELVFDVEYSGSESDPCEDPDFTDGAVSEHLADIGVDVAEFEITQRRCSHC